MTGAAMGLMVALLFLPGCRRGITTTEPSPDRQALEYCRLYRGTVSGLSLESLLDVYSVGPDAKDPVVSRDWQVSRGPGTSWKVTYTAIRGGQVLAWEWMVDRNAGTVTPNNDAARALEAFDKELALKLRPPPSPTAAPVVAVVTASPTATAAPMASPGAATISPSPTGNINDELVAVPPPEDLPTLPSGSPAATPARPTPPPPVAPPPPPPPPPEPPPPVEVKGIYNLGRGPVAVLDINGGTYEASIGSKLPDGMRVSDIRGRTVVLTWRGQRLERVLVAPPSGTIEFTPADGAPPRTAPPPDEVDIEPPAPPPPPPPYIRPTPAPPRPPITPTETPTEIQVAPPTP